MADRDRVTVRIYESDKERLQEIADATGQHVSDVLTEFIREPAYVCPECGDPFDPSEVDPETVEEHGMMTTGVDKLVKGQREVKHFDCPTCSETISPADIEAADADDRSGITRREMGVTEEAEQAEFSSEEA